MNGWLRNRWIHGQKPLTGGKDMGVLTTNMADVFNLVLRGARSLSITATVQFIFYWLVAYFRDCSDKIDKIRCTKTRCGTNIMKIIQKRTNNAKHKVIVFQVNGLCSVTTHARDGSWGNVQHVDLNAKKCDCG